MARIRSVAGVEIMAPRSPNIQPQKMKLMNTITLGSSALLLMNRGITMLSTAAFRTTSAVPSPY